MNSLMRISLGISLQASLIGSTYCASSDYTSALIIKTNEPAFVKLAGELQRNSAFPVYLPSFRAMVSLAPYLNILVNNRDLYDVQLARSSSCAGHSECAVAEIVGQETYDATTPLLSGKRVLLRNGSSAFWTAHDCAYLGCDFSKLTYTFDGHLYAVAIINGSIDDVRGLAEAMSIIK